MTGVSTAKTERAEPQPLILQQPAWCCPLPYVRSGVGGGINCDAINHRQPEDILLDSDPIPPDLVIIDA